MILFLKPYFEVKPWASNKLNKIYDCPDKTGEAWIVSGYKNKSSIIMNGKYKGQTLRHLWTKHPELFGNYEEKEFPLLLKLISASQKLSVQVHPNDEYALSTANQLGKFECWYFLPGNEATSVTTGVVLKNGAELKHSIENNTIENFLINKDIKDGDLVIIEPGRIHALDAGSFVLEVQEASDLTYRLYDYNRLPKRELHLNDALNVIDYNNDKNIVYDFTLEDTFKNSHFNLYKIKVNGKDVYKNKGFEIFYVIKGNGSIDDVEIKQGDSFILTSEREKFSVNGDFEAIAVIPKPKSKERKKMRKTALITGVISQDGYYLTKLLLENNYEVHGMIQSKSQYASSYLFEFDEYENFFTHIGDMTDTSNINRLIECIKPDEIYHLASQSHVDLSFELPEYTAQVNALGTLRLLDAIKNNEIRTKLFNLESPYLFDGTNPIQDEKTQFNPKSPYAIAKEFAYRMVQTYRENYNIYAVNGICYNHTSAFKSSAFVSKKIINTINKLKNGEEQILELGNLDSIREWGNAKEYAYAMWLSLQQDRPDDYIISTGKGYKVREFVEKAYKKLNVDIKWEGHGLDEVGINSKTGKVLIKINKKFLRANEIKSLVGDSKKFNKLTGYKLSSDIDNTIEEMLSALKMA